jgi:hypothetical protein
MVSSPAKFRREPSFAKCESPGHPPARPGSSTRLSLTGGKTSEAENNPEILFIEIPRPPRRSHNPSVPVPKLRDESRRAHLPYALTRPESATTSLHRQGRVGMGFEASRPKFA